MSIALYFLLFVVIGVVASFPGWVCVINSWPSRNSSKVHNTYYLLSLILFMLCLGLIGWLYWFLIFSSPEDWKESSGLVTIMGMVITPFISLVVTVPLGFLLERSAKKRGLWNISKFKLR